MDPSKHDQKEGQQLHSFAPRHGQLWLGDCISGARSPRDLIATIANLDVGAHPDEPRRGFLALGIVLEVINWTCLDVIVFASGGLCRTTVHMTNIRKSALPASSTNPEMIQSLITRVLTNRIVVLDYRVYLVNEVVENGNPIVPVVDVFLPVDYKTDLEKFLDKDGTLNSPDPFENEQKSIAASIFQALRPDNIDQHLVNQNKLADLLFHSAKNEESGEDVEQLRTDVLLNFNQWLLAQFGEDIRYRTKNNFREKRFHKGGAHPYAHPGRRQLAAKRERPNKMNNMFSLLGQAAANPQPKGKPWADSEF